eukprot:TRINITY_DN13357_c8_g1_i1.p1 TRINITY_DN13357_c8_g1~~TRINITY_DN13357_c8_g1_i1.p1  ORF type:complete len:403 (-),score=159.16 TRINITY_DN13357_c8_g1_i1:39-1247(-)
MQDEKKEKEQQENENQQEETQEENVAPKKNHKKYRRDKPWDNDSIDHWKIEPFVPDDKTKPFLEESSFATLFPKYREQYLREVWPLVTRSLEGTGVACTLNMVEGSMSVKTTRKTFDPYAIIKARDLIKLLSRGVPAPQALKILEDDVWCDIIKIGNSVTNKERFVKRRQRLIGPNGSTLKALEILTGCYILVQGKTVSCMGPIKGIKQVRSIVEDCMANIHPVYSIKTLMIKRELAKDPELAHENWDRFIPQFKGKNVQKPKKPKEGEKKEKKPKKEYTPFPPLPTKRKEDIELETGEYFMGKERKAAKAKMELLQKQQQKALESKMKRSEAFIAPEEEVTAPKPKHNESLESLKSKFLEGEKRKRESEKPSASSASSSSSSKFTLIEKDKPEKKKSRKER